MKCPDFCRGASSILSFWRIRVIAITVLFTDATIHSMNSNFLIVIYCYFTSTFKCLLLCTKVSRTAFRVFLFHLPFFAIVYNMYIFAFHITSFLFL